MSNTGELLNELIEGINESYRLSIKFLDRNVELEKTLQSRDAAIEELSSDLAAANQTLSEMEGKQLISNKAITYLYEQWPSGYPRFYELIDAV